MTGELVKGPENRKGKNKVFSVKKDLLKESLL